MPILTPLAAASLKQWGFLSSAQLAATDPYFAYTTLLLHGDGTNGAQNNTFLDSSTNNFTITRNGNTTQGTFSPFSGPNGYWSNYFDGSGDYLQATDASAFDLSNFDWCFECWAYIQGTGTQTLLSLTDTGASAGSNAVLNIQYVGSTSKITWSTGSSSGISNQSITSTNTFSTNQFLHVAAVRDGATITLYVNGANEGTYNVSTGTFNASRDYLYIGNRRSNSGLTDYLTGYLSNVRVVINDPVYTAPFTPSTTPLTAITNTSLLTCQSNRFVDNSTNNFAITVNGNTSIQPFSPFAPSAAYSAATNGGSGYFDGSGDYLSVADNAAFEVGSGSFTAEMWVNVSTTSNSPILVGKWVSADQNRQSWVLYLNTNNTVGLIFRDSGNNAVTVTTTTTITLNQWNHIACSKNGTTVKIFINGVEGVSSTLSLTARDSSEVLGIGASSVGLTPVTGYLSNVRIVKGTAVYTSNFTPPTSPVTAIANTSLLLNFTNAGILDNTGRNNLETVGNAQISTSVKKFGTGSLAFDGSGDYLTTPSNQFVSWGTGDFTIEGWFYWNSLASESAIMFGSGVGWTFYIYPANKLQWGRTSPQTPANLLTGSTTLATGQWYHIAVTRASGTVTLWVNGVSDGTISDTANYSASGNLRLGISHSSSYFNGYIDDLRITKGVARYTSNFTPPTAAFEDQ